MEQNKPITITITITIALEEEKQKGVEDMEDQIMKKR